MKIDLLFENNQFLILNKPSGLVVHPYDFSSEYTVLDFLQERYPAIFQNSENNTITLQDKRVINLGGIVHKLDRDTSGVMVVAKDRETYTSLQKQFREHTTKKMYIALIEGHIDQDHFTIDAPLGREKKGYKQIVNPTRARGELRDAKTIVTTITSQEKNSESGASIITSLQLEPLTGRTHQLRAHMASIGHPIVGDIAYGSTIASPRIMLHAQTLAFTLDGKEYIFEAEIPKEFM